MLTHTQASTCRFMYTSNNVGSIGGSGLAYNYPFPLEVPFNVPPNFLFRSGQHEIVDSNHAMPQYSSPGLASSSQPGPQVSLNYSAVNNSSINQSMESIADESLLSAQSSPEYSVPDYQNRSYYSQISADDQSVGIPGGGWLSNAEGNDFELIGPMTKKEINNSALSSCKSKHKKTKLLPKHEIMGKYSYILYKFSIYSHISILIFYFNLLIDRLQINSFAKKYFLLKTKKLQLLFLSLSLDRIFIYFLIFEKEKQNERGEANLIIG